MTHKELEVWKKSRELSKEIYIITKVFPKEEIYGLTSQIRRAVVSIASNIAEGSARNSDKKFIHFFSDGTTSYISLGSLAELETQLIISKEIGYIDSFSFDKISIVRKMLLGLINYIRNKS